MRARAVAPAEVEEEEAGRRAAASVVGPNHPLRLLLLLLTTAKASTKAFPSAPRVSESSWLGPFVGRGWNLPTLKQ